MPRLDHLLTMGALRDPSRPFLLGAVEWTYAKADEEVNERAARFRRLSSGLPVCLRAVNSPSWVLNLLALLRANIPAILIPSELTDREIKALIQVAGTQFKLDGDRWETTSIKPASMPEWLGQDVGVGFTTSGSTGEPRIALRSHPSLTDEGQRYQLLWEATPDDVFLAPAPLYHAYTFGAALAAALTAGATLIPLVFKSPQLVSRQIQEFGATIMPLVPAMARMLAVVDQGKPLQSKLRIVMAGAGQTTDEISTLFSLRWGVGLSRNYGSSETGAILATLNPAAGNATGDPMPGIHCELVENTGQPGSLLWVRLKHPPAGYLGSSGYEPIQISPGGWWPMGDVFERNANGGLRLIGRRGSAIRRGGHSIQPREIEMVLLSSPAVAEAYVKGLMDRHGEECVEAHVALKEPGSVTAEDLDRFLKAKLALYKIPNRWHFYDKLPKTWTSKISTQQLTVDEPPPHSTLFQAVQGFRLSHAIFAAEQLGVLRELDGEPKPLSEIANKLSCDVHALGFLLDYLRSRGVVTGSAAGYKLTRRSDVAWSSICSLEEHLRETWLSAGQIVAVVRNGLHNRPFEQKKEASEFSDLYIEAFCGPWQDYVALLLQRKLRLPLKGAGLEVGRAAGRIALYLRKALQMNCRFCALGPEPNLAWRELPELERLQTYTWGDLPLPPNSLDVIVLTNVVHWLKPEEAQPALRRMLEALRPTGTLAVIDTFVDATPESSQFLLDWLTHGGVHSTRIRDLKGHFDEAGFAHVDSEAIREMPIQLITCRGLAALPQTENLTLTEKKK
ncbi:MAG TPA: AMP-binding protein [Candidatus Polarisedimenticolia bacterium]|jgi:long-chain acyl-CoA synthetase|nr:AMP-binding protein [Candidatus Polarisedimenticolia bacterium]